MRSQSGAHGGFIILTESRIKTELASMETAEHAAVLEVQALLLYQAASQSRGGSMNPPDRNVNTSVSRCPPVAVGWIGVDSWMTF